MRFSSIMDCTLLKVETRGIVPWYIVVQMLSTFRQRLSLRFPGDRKKMDDDE